MAESLRAADVDAFTFSPRDVVHDVVRGRVECAGVDLASLDGVVVKKLGDQSDASTRLRLHALRAVEAAGARVFSPPDVIDVAMDRYRMTLTMASAGLPVPETIVAEGRANVLGAVARLGDCVIKPVYTSKARGMIRMNSSDADGSSDACIDEQGRYVVQRFVEAPGRDIGATVIAGRVAGAFYRVAREGEWATTTHQGGTYAPCPLSERGVDLAERAAALFGLDYTVVDLVEQGDDFLLYEVSAFGGFRGLLEATGIDPSVLYARHVVETLEARR
ncbi:MAG TPA: ATP-grasp family protein [Dehalococcoidia bacterium]